MKCFYWPTSIDGLLIVQYSIGLALAGFNYWAKVDAHRCIGEYCWYWGDFFYRKDQNLTFDGIFELFPHPMYVHFSSGLSSLIIRVISCNRYTVGYSLYYGYSLICRSYTMLFVSLFAHLLQILFLVCVEEPHIEKIYGTNKVADEDKARVLYDPRSGLFPRKDSVYFRFMDPFNPSDIALVCLSAYAILLAWCMDNSVWCIIQVVIWRLIHWCGLGSILWLQSERQYWTRHFMSRGRTLYEAFSNWKRLYNLSLTMNVVVFIGCALRHFEFDFPADLTSGHAMGCIVCGIILILLNLWSSASTYQSVGDFGWFYGDFFISTDAYRNHLCYTGIYRFLNNPDCVTGYAGYYGLALIGRNWKLFFVCHSFTSFHCHIILYSTHYCYVLCQSSIVGSVLTSIKCIVLSIS
jgi:phosphatidylethanolamine N-methyltransferase